MFSKIFFVFLLFHSAIHGIHYNIIHIAGVYQYNPHIQQRLEDGRQWQNKIESEQSDCWKVYYIKLILECCPKNKFKL